ncbi:MAG: hypothetical protein ABW123_04695 [Cystobacter sp.]
MKTWLRSGCLVMGAVGLGLGCGPREAVEEDSLAVQEQALPNSCQSTSAAYTFGCATVFVYASATSTAPIDRIECGGAYWSATLLRSCPSNGRFKVEYTKEFSGEFGTGWVEREILAVQP